MTPSYNIINKNLEKLNNAIKTFPDILGKYQKSKDPREKLQIREYAYKLDLRSYIDFIDWVEKMSETGQSIIYKHQISFNEFKETLVNNAINNEVKDFLKKKTRRGMITFLQSRLYNDYNGEYRGRRFNRKSYANNFKSSTSVISNYLIQNPDIIESNKDLIWRLETYYINELPNFEAQVNTEIDITNDIIRTLSRKINTIKYDFRKLNFNLLRSEIESKIKEKMLSVDKGEKIKCIESQNGLTVNKVYDVISYEIGTNGNLLVSVRNDNDISYRYNYRIFETISKLRQNNIDDILKLIEE